MVIDISKKHRLTIETFNGSANGGKSFTGIRFRLGKRNPRVVFRMHHSKALQMIEALESCLAEITPTDNFSEGRAWQELRYETLKKYRKCVLCGSTKDLQVDHIKPRSKYPELALDPDNLVSMCRSCNLGKGNRDSIDYR